MLRPRWLGLRSITKNCPWRRCHSVDSRPFAVNDHVLIENLHDRYTSPSLLRLRAGEKKDTHKGSIHHDDIIGKRAREVVESRISRHKGNQKVVPYRLRQVRLEEYVRLTKRLVTPLYPQDAQLIVSLLDLHPEPRSADASQQDNGPALEILEAGTGHGALTLYLSRAIHAANIPTPRQDGIAESPSSEPGNVVSEEADPYRKASRNAVIHSIELNAKHSAHAERIVRDFRHALYHSNVDFHVGSVGTWVTSELARRKNQAFLTHAFLDLPGTEDYLSTVTAALRTAGILIVFNPSLTQIMDCLAKIKEEGLDLELEKVVELGVNGGTGGREWDLRAVMPRATAAAAAAAAINGADFEGGEALEERRGPIETDLEEANALRAEESGSDFSSLDESPYPLPAQPGRLSQEQGWKMVCRPKVGDLTVGGGFLAVFAKKRW
nr:trna (adenine(58)-n(1))-methyltransferase trmi [Quercus suber]